MVLPLIGGAMALGGLVGGAINAFRKPPQAEAPDVEASAFRDPYAQANKTMLAGRQAGVDARVAPTMQAAQIGPMQQIGAPDLAGANSAMGGQQRLAQMLLAQAQGTAGPSLAEMQLQSGLQGNVATQMAIAGSQAGGGNPMLAARQLQSGIAAAGLDTSGQAAALRAQEQMAAQQALGQVLAQQGQLGLGVGELGQQGQMFNAGQVNQAALQQGAFQQQANQANLGAGLQTQAQQDAMTQYLLGQRLGIDARSFEGQMALQNLLSQNQLATNQMNLGAEMGQRQAQNQFFGGLVGGGASLGAASLMGPRAPVGGT